MKALFVIHDQLSNEQLDNSYLLCLAMLNFEHEVDVVFVDGSLQKLQVDDLKYNKWMTLKLYGVNHCYQLNTVDNSDTSDGSETVTEPISMIEFTALKHNMDFVT